MIGALILIVIILAVGIFYWSEVSAFVSGAMVSIQEKKDNTIINPTPEKGAWVCDLVINVEGTYDKPWGLVESLDLKIGTENWLFGTTEHGKITYDWRNCYQKGNFSLFSFVPIPQAIQASLLSFGISLGDDSFDIDLSLIGLSDSRRITSSQQSSLKETVVIPAGFVTLPAKFHTNHVARDVVCQDYTVELKSFQHIINGKTAGTPFTDTIKKSNTCTS